MRSTPRYDMHQDWILKTANEDGQSTTLRFERKLDTCDKEDIAINFVSQIDTCYTKAY